MPRPPNTEPRTRLNLEIPVRLRERMERLRQTLEADSLTEVIRRALVVYEALLTTREGHGKVFIRAADGTEQEIVVF